MTDIVERLDRQSIPSQDIEDAKEEIKTLRAEIERLRAIIQGFTGRFITLEIARRALEPKP